MASLGKHQFVPEFVNSLIFFAIGSILLIGTNFIWKSNTYLAVILFLLGIFSLIMCFIFAKKSKPGKGLVAAGVLLVFSGTIFSKVKNSVLAPLTEIAEPWVQDNHPDFLDYFMKVKAILHSNGEGNSLLFVIPGLLLVGLGVYLQKEKDVILNVTLAEGEVLDPNKLIGKKRY